MFKKKKKVGGKIRAKAKETAEELNDEPSVSEILAETREAQDFRKRTQGVSSIGLATGEKITPDVEAELGATGWSLSKGGIMPKLAKDRDRDREDDDVVNDLSKTFTGTQDIDWEDEQMKKYVEEQIRLGHGQADNKEKELTDYEKRRLEMYKVPEDLRKLQKMRRAFHEDDIANPEQGIISNSMLSGIPEVDLGVDAKIKNIEETEQARLARIQGKQQKPKEPKVKVKATVDTDIGYGRARFMRGKPKKAGVVHVEGTELTDHKQVFEQALKEGFKSVVTESVTSSKDGRKEYSKGGDYKSDDAAFEQYRKKARKW